MERNFILSGQSASSVFAISVLLREKLRIRFLETGFWMQVFRDEGLVVAGEGLSEKLSACNRYRAVPDPSSGWRERASS